MTWGQTSGAWGAGGTGYYMPDNGTADPAVAANLAAQNQSYPLSPATSPATTPATDPNAQNTADAQAIIGQLLDSYGLSSLDSWAYGLITSGATPAMIDMQLRQQPAFAQRFPGIAMRQAAGLPPISPGEYVSYENAAIQAFTAAGLPSDFYSTSNHLANFIGSDVSISELQDRVKNGYQAAMQAPVEVRNELQSLYGIDAGHLTAFFLDPAQAEPLIMRKFAAAKLGGEAAITGYTSPLSATTLEGLASQGVTDAQGQAGFSKLGHESQLFGALPGQSGEQNISQDIQLGAEFGANAADQKAIQDQANSRVAAFAGGGGYAGSSTGVSGLGSANK